MLPGELCLFAALDFATLANLSVPLPPQTAVFGCTAAILGPWLERAGPFRGALLGAVLFYAGNLIAALGVGVKSIAVVYIGYGFIGGMGLGIAYIAPVSPLQKWFPELRGLAAGVAVCGFGGGSIIAPYTQKLLIGTNYAKMGEVGKNLGVPLTFIILGTCYFVLMFAAAVVLRMPPPGYSVNGINIETIKGAETHSEFLKASEKKAGDVAVVEENVTAAEIVDVPAAGTDAAVTAPGFGMTLWESLTSKEFILMYFMFFCSQITGLLIISKMQQITVNQFGKSADEGVLINALLGGSNLLGRLAVPLLTDLTKSRKALFVTSTLCQLALLASLPATIASQTYWAFLFCCNFIAFFYGAGFGIIPAYLADQFGSKNVGATHGVILTAWAAAGVCGALVFTTVYSSNLNSVYYIDAGATKKTYHPPSAVYHVYDTNFRWILAFVAVGVILACAVPADIRDRKLPKVEGEWFRIRAFGRMIRVIKGRPVIVSREQEREEWAAFLMNREKVVAVEEKKAEA
ncbi:hypothetical protein HK101_008475 [Irineochytrium annulatum]|nr:hypothetical protein HK101_008475 [Irineochytrium annulatum]